MATLVRTPEGFFQQGQAGLVPITDPVQLRDLNAGNTSYVDESSGPQVDSPTITKSSLPQAPSVPGAPAGGSAPTPDSPYTIFNKNMASMLTQIQQTQSSGAAKLGGNIATATNVGVSPNGAQPFDPNVSSSVQIAGREGLSDAFQPVIANMNTRLTNTTAALGALSGNVKSLMEAYAPQVLQPGQSLVTPEGKVIKQGHAYTFQLNPNTGVYDGYDSTTSTWASQDNAGAGPTPVLSQGGHQGSTIVGGIELGSSPDGNIQPWATSTDAAHQVNNIYNDLKKNIPVPGAPAYDQYIKNNGGGSVTGSMIINSSKLHNIDPSLLAAILNNESDFGNSNVSTKDNNPGGITYSGAPGQVQGSPRPQSEGGYYVKYNSLAQGVDAVATALQKRIVSPQAQTTPDTGATSPVGGQFSPEASQKVSQLPTGFQSYVDAGPAGVAYINEDRIPADVKDSLKLIASRAGIPFLQGGDVSVTKNLGILYNSVNDLEDKVKTNLGVGVKGAVGDFLKTTIHNVTLGNAFPSLSSFNSFRTIAINAIQGLAGGQSSGLRITNSEIAAALDNIPTSTDTVANANIKLNALLKMMNNHLQSTFPYAQGKQTIDNSSSSFSTIAPNGKTYTFPDQTSLNTFKASAGIQ